MSRWLRVLNAACLLTMLAALLLFRKSWTDQFVALNHDKREQTSQIADLTIQLDGSKRRAEQLGDKIRQLEEKAIGLEIDLATEKGMNELLAKTLASAIEKLKKTKDELLKAVTRARNAEEGFANMVARASKDANTLAGARTALTELQTQHATARKANDELKDALIDAQNAMFDAVYAKHKVETLKAKASTIETALSDADK